METKKRGKWLNMTTVQKSLKKEVLGKGSIENGSTIKSNWQLLFEFREKEEKEVGWVVTKNV